jgi:transcription antitermination protein NusB
VTTTEPRVAALEALYEADQRGEAPRVAGATERVIRIAEGVWSERDDLDRAIAAVAEGWRVERMPVVDRTVLRIGLWELRHTSLPVAVVVAEAVKLAKAYSTDRSGAFVNGVLSALVPGERAGREG